MVMMFIPSCPSVSQKPMNLNYLSKHIALSKYKRDLKRGSIERPQILPSTSGNAVGLRVFVLSDLHTDYADNMKWVKSISTVTHKKDVLLVAGDVAELYDNFVLTMSLLKDRFEHIFYIPGNHDLWCRLDGEDYVRNIISLLETTCDTLACSSFIGYDLIAVPSFIKIWKDKIFKNLFNCSSSLALNYL